MEDRDQDKPTTPSPSESEISTTDLEWLVAKRREELGIPPPEKVEAQTTPIALAISTIPLVETIESIAAREQKLKYQQNLRRYNAWGELVQSRGTRYEACSLDNFYCYFDKHEQALNLTRDYCADLLENIKSGYGILFFGPKGTGKDHLAMAVCREIVRADLRVKWQNGMDMFGDVRDMMDEDGGSEKVFVDRMVRPDVLYLSDPLPPFGKLTEFQASMLFRILDGRYSRCKPLIVTMNVSGGAELDERLGPQNGDRLRDGSLAVFCNWPSYRKAARNIKGL